MPATHQVSKDLDWLAAEIGKRSDGKITVEPYHGGELYGHDTAPDAVISGAIDMAVDSMGEVWPGYNIFFEATQLWFLAANADQVYANLDKVRQIAFPLYEELGVVPLSFWAFGQGGLWSRSPIYSPADIKGKIIRAPTQGDWTCIGALGATAAQIPSGEMYDALAKGSIDAIRTGFDSGVSRKLFEPASYLSGPTQFTLYFTFVNPDIWNGLSQEYRDLIAQAHMDAQERNFTNVKAATQAALVTAADGCEVHMFTSGEQAQWIQAMQTIYSNWIDECEKAGYGSQAREYYELMK